MKKFIHTALLFFIFFTATVSAQLSDFNLAVVKADETCTGNGSLTCNVTNPTPNASFLYKLYKLPNVATATSIISTNYFAGLSAGNYRVIVLQTLGSMQNTKTVDITIDNKIVPFAFTVAAANQNCSAGGGIILSATTGTISQCEIMSGPQMRGLQTSPVFDNLPAGRYNVRAFNECGIGRVRTFTLSLVTTDLNISDPIYPDVINPLCDSIRVNNIITPSNGTINYPLTVKHTLSSMDIAGNSVVYERVLESGSPTSETVSVMMPRLIGQAFSYDLEIIDNCGMPFSKDGVDVDQDIDLSLSLGDAPCAYKFIKLNVSKYTTAYTVEFLEKPAGFNPASFNATPGGPFANAETQYGTPENPVPFGNYVIKVTDVCGRSTTETILVEFIKPTPSKRPFNDGCFSLFGGFDLSVPRQKIVTATITAVVNTNGAENYTDTHTLPELIDSKINAQGTVKLTHIPLGKYTVTFTDDCGYHYIVEITVPEYRPQEFVIKGLPSCAPEFGTMNYKGGNGAFTEAVITSGPDAFHQTYPFDVTSSIAADGQVYMDNLPEGTYTFKATDRCGIVTELPVNVEGYIAPVNSVEFRTDCGSFAVKVTDNSNGLEGATYWLQKLNVTTGKWGHPNGSNTIYVEGTTPTAGNAIRIYNRTERNNLNYSGKFRVVKKFESYASGTSNNTSCVSTLDEFEYTEEFKVTTAYNLTCLQRPNDIVIEVVGYPTSFKIEKKDGQSFVVDNGTSNTFINLAPGEYVFRIQDDCGNVLRPTYNIQALPAVSVASQPTDMVVCVAPGTATGTHEYHLTDKNPEVLGPLYSALYDITYYASSEDAENETNALPEYYNGTSGQTIYVRLENNQIGLCHGSTSFKLFAGETLEPKITVDGQICDSQMIKLTANAGYDQYKWTTGETTRSIFVRDAGVYGVTVTNTYGTSAGCPGSVEVTIDESFSPTITDIETTDWTTDENTITIHTTGGGDYVYSVDGVHYQTENVFNGLESGSYIVYVKDTKGCGLTKKEVILLNYPNYFTPNGDGVNETWFIKNSSKEPHLRVNIFDRYGKLITAFGPTSEGWDGTLNGIQLPSTDYWFVVTREDGRELKGHFSMVR